MSRIRNYRDSGLPQEYAKEYRAWNNMKRRCDNPRVDSYECYGGRGIKVCDRWLGWDGFPHFLEDLGPCPEGYSLDRINVDGNYEPENCRWADFYTQCRNKRQNHYIYLDGEKMILKDACAKLGIKHQTVCQRISAYGWDEERALKTPVRERRTIE